MRKEILPILIIDDDSFQRRMIRIKLQTRGYEVNEAKDGKEAINFLAEQKYSLVLLDIVMPQLNGWDVLDQIRSKFSSKELPVIMMTAQDNSFDADAASERGASSYLTKPIDFGNLDTQIDGFLSQQTETTAKPADPPGSDAFDTQTIAAAKKANSPEPQLSLLEGLTNNLPGVVFRAAADAERNVHLIYQSEGLKRFLGRRWKNVQEIIASTDSTTRSRLNRKFADGCQSLECILFRFESRWHSRSLGWVECRATPHRLPSGDTVWDALLLDVTEAMRLEHRLTENRRADLPQDVDKESTRRLQAIADAGAELATAIEDGNDTHTALHKLRAAQGSAKNGNQDSAFRDASGFVNQCSQCRKVQSPDRNGRWELVPEWQKHMPLNTNHMICPSCSHATNPLETD